MAKNSEDGTFVVECEDACVDFSSGLVAMKIEDGEGHENDNDNDSLADVSLLVCVSILPPCCSTQSLDGC